MESKTEPLVVRWCVVANIVDQRPQVQGYTDMRAGTKHFGPGAKVHIFGVYAGTCDSVIVVGRHRGSQRFVRMTLGAHLVHKFRAKGVYSPAVLELMKSGTGGAVEIRTEEQATDWARALPSWGPPNYGVPD